MVKKHSVIFSINQLSPYDRDIVYKHVSQVEDYECYFKEDPEYKVICDLLVRLAFLKVKGFIFFERIKLYDGSIGVYHKIKEGIDFDDWEYDELNDGGGLCIAETYRKYGLQILEPILKKY